jgi:hypothetical protein
VAGCCECGDEPSGSCATQLVSYGLPHFQQYYHLVSLQIPGNASQYGLFAVELVNCHVINYALQTVFKCIGYLLAYLINAHINETKLCF